MSSVAPCGARVLEKVCDLPAAEVRAIIDAALEREDNFVNAPPMLKAFTQASGCGNGINHALEALRLLRQQRPEFFCQMPYVWASEAHAYRRPIDAALQIQALQQLASFWPLSKDYAIDPDGFGQVVCLMAIAPSTFGPGPRVLPASEDTAAGLIVFPSGWFVALAVFLELARVRQSEDDFRFQALTKGVYAQAVSEAFFCRELLRRQDIEVPVGRWDLIRFAIVEHLEANHPALRGAITDLRSFRSTPERWLAMDRATVTFTIAHELSHILRGDHRPPRREADESLADQIAFDIMAYSPQWKQLTQAAPVQDGLARSAFAYSLFIFVGLLHLRIRQLTEGGDDTQERMFLERAHQLQLAAQVQPIPDDQRRLCSAQAAQLTETRKQVEHVFLKLQESDPQLDAELCQEAIDNSLRRFVG